MHTTLPPAPTTTETFLGGFGTDPAALGVDAHVFGALVKLALPVLTNYHSDLYRDAQWLQANLTADVVGDALTFWFVVRPSGTHIVQSADMLAAVRGVFRDDNPRVYSVAVVNRRGSWSLLVTVNS
jgi:hypothetical protein